MAAATNLSVSIRCPCQMPVRPRAFQTNRVVCAFVGNVTTVAELTFERQPNPVFGGVQNALTLVGQARIARWVDCASAGNSCVRRVVEIHSRASPKAAFLVLKNLIASLRQSFRVVRIFVYSDVSNGQDAVRVWAVAQMDLDGDVEQWYGVAGCVSVGGGKRWGNLELREVEKALPPMKVKDLRGAATSHTSTTGVGVGGFHLKVLLDLSDEMCEKILTYLLEVEMAVREHESPWKTGHLSSEFCFLLTSLN